MSESQAHCAQLSDVEPGDFARYLEYAYRSDYTEPSWVQDDLVEVVVNDIPTPATKVSEFTPWAEPEVLTEEVTTTIDAWNFGMVAKRQEKKTFTHRLAETRNTLRSKIAARLYLSLDGEPRLLGVFQFSPRSNTSPNQNFSPIFLAHARLYTFADMRLIEPLKCLALSKLRDSLLAFRLYPERTGDVIELARHAYSNGNDRGVDGTVEDLRRLVVDYIVSELSTFKKDVGFVSLLEDGGEFAGDLWCTVVQESLL